MVALTRESNQEDNTILADVGSNATAIELGSHGPPA